jgi:hypothetical protein
MIIMVYDTKNIKVEALFEPALRASAALTRLDERLRTSPVRGGNSVDNRRRPANSRARATAAKDGWRACDVLLVFCQMA